ncbi:CDP-glycerol glycerophosphotransferase family protein [Turicibacter sanguinis]|uniref:CDP-glycerol glycerophosphotransferase family protein n=1 Tax=Turicibacter sanguinis TaxID=154288 RepID=UPI00189A9EE4|nr:CDP-glycerol glycerophosphotransferase family protein [Turicibacter sanguinis]
MRHLIRNCLIKFFTFFPLKKKRIFFESFNGSKYADSIKILYEYMQHQNKNYDYIWVLDNNSFQFQYENTKKIKRKSIKYYYYYATSKYIITNVHKHGMKPNKKAKLVLIWHGAGAFKKFGLDVDRKCKGREEELYADGKTLDYLICSSKNVVDTYSKALAVDKEKIYPIGLPRNDIFYDERVKEIISKEFQKRFNSFNKTVVLYAPTHRNSELSFTINQDLVKVFNALSETHIFLIKTHYYIQKNISSELFSDSIYDVSDFNDIQELLVFSDILITDYSSVFYDFGLQMKPTLFFAYDLEDYEREWGFYHCYREYVPGPIATNPNQLVEFLKDENLLNESKKKMKSFIKDYDDYKDGKSTQRVFELIFDEREEE